MTAEQLELLPSEATADEGNSPKVTHGYLVERAARWLRNSRRCGVVITHQFAILSEVPDALGWQTSGHSILVECKTSCSDFRRDLKKPMRRRPDEGLGSKCYYLAPPGIVPPEELPEGWGLLECHPRTIRTVKFASKTFNSDTTVKRERVILLAEIRRRNREAREKET